MLDGLNWDYDGMKMITGIIRFFDEIFILVILFIPRNPS
jgi:hypothetical protein